MGIKRGATGDILPDGGPNPAAPPTISRSDLRGPTEGRGCEPVLLDGLDADRTAARTTSVRRPPYNSSATTLFGLVDGPRQAEGSSVTGG